MQIIGLQQRKYFTLDEILKDIPETATEELSDIEEAYQNFEDELNAELKTTDMEWLEFHAGQCEQVGKVGKSLLYRVVKSSVHNTENSIAAANAITILKTMNVSFSCLDLQAVQIPGADLSRAVLNNANLSGAKLENVNLASASLNNTNLVKSDLKDVQFDMPDILSHEYKVFSSLVSPDNKYLVSEDNMYIYFWDIPSKTCIKKIEMPKEYGFPKRKIFTSDGRFLLIHDGEQSVDIWATADFEYIKKLEIFEGEVENISFSFSPNENYFVTKHNLKNQLGTTVQFFEVRGYFDVSLKHRFSTADTLGNLYFSKKFPVFYCLRSDFMNPNIEIRLSIWNIEGFNEVSNTVISTNQDFIDLLSNTKFDTKQSRSIEFFSLDICEINKNNEECLYIAIGKFIYIINILKGDEKNWVLKSVQNTKALTDIDIIYGIQILTSTNVLIYLCNDAICLYDIQNRSVIGRFRLTDLKPQRFLVSLDGVHVYLNSSNKVYIYPIEALKNSRNVSYVLDSATSCFSPDMKSISSISNTFYLQTYDIETGHVQRLSNLQKAKVHLSSKSMGYNALLTLGEQYVFINSSTTILKAVDITGLPKASTIYNLCVVDTLSEEIVLDDIQNNGILAVSNTSKYFAVVLDYESEIAIYETNSSSKRLIGQFDITKDSVQITKLILSSDFSNRPKIALVDDTEVLLLEFHLNNGALELISKTKLSREFVDVVQLSFVENDSKLLVVCKEKIVLLNLEDLHYEECNIQSTFVNIQSADISRDGSLLAYYNSESSNLDTTIRQLCLWSIAQKKLLIVQTFSLVIDKVQISPDNRYIIGTTESGGMYVWKIVGNTFRLLWRTSHNLQTQGLVLGENSNLDKDIEKNLLAEMGAVKLQATSDNTAIDYENNNVFIAEETSSSSSAENNRYTTDFSNEQDLTHTELLSRIKYYPNTEKLVLRNCTRIATTVLFDLLATCPNIKEVDMSLDKPENCLRIQPRTFLSEVFASREFNIIKDKHHLALEKLDCSNHTEMSGRIFRNIAHLLSPKSDQKSSLKEIILTGCPVQSIDLTVLNEKHENKSFSNIQKFIAADGPYNSPGVTLSWLNDFILNNKQLKELNASFSKYFSAISTSPNDDEYTPNIYQTEFFFTHLSKKLKALNLDYRPDLLMNNNAIKALLSHPKLESLSIQIEFEKNIEEMTFNDSLTKTNFREIVIRSKTISDSIIQALLQHSPNLEKLTLDGCVELTQKSICLEMFKNCPKFQELNLYHMSKLSDDDAIDDLAEKFDVYTL